MRAVMNLRAIGAAIAAVLIVLSGVMLARIVPAASQGNSLGSNGQYETMGHQPVTICHKPGTPAEQTLTVDINALPGHLGHGDYEGECARDDEGEGTILDPPPVTNDIPNTTVVDEPTIPNEGTTVANEPTVPNEGTTVVNEPTVPNETTECGAFCPDGRGTIPETTATPDEPQKPIEDIDEPTMEEAPPTITVVVETPDSEAPEEQITVEVPEPVIVNTQDAIVSTLVAGGTQEEAVDAGAAMLANGGIARGEAQEAVANKVLADVQAGDLPSTGGPLLPIMLVSFMMIGMGAFLLRRVR